MKFEIELKPEQKSLIRRAEKLVSDGSYWDADLIRAINTVKYAVSISVEDLNFALSVLNTTVNDASA